MLPYLEYVEPRPAAWPEADFIIGNPPYMGNKRMRDAFGDGYVDALRAAYPDVPESADYVMYWWHRAALEVASGRVERAGLITTNSITQAFNRVVVADALTQGVGVSWAIPTHPWIDETGSAAVRVAMTVVERDPRSAVRLEVNDQGEVVSQTEVERLGSDLSGHADISRAASEPLLANAGLSSRGFTLVGRGFVLANDEAEDLRAVAGDSEELVRPYLSGQDLARGPRGVFVIDFGMRDEDEAREHPVFFDLVRDRVKPQRDANNRASYRDLWWRFGEPRTTLREAMGDLVEFIATPYVAKHRFFVMLDRKVAPDETIVCIASADPFVLGVLSSKIHEAWSLAAGSRLGVGNDPRYNNSLCFDPFPFPDAEGGVREAVIATVQRLHQHREQALVRDDAVTMTRMYNVVDKLRKNASLTDPERHVHEAAACGSLRDLHDQLDAAVAACYGWSWPLDTDAILDRVVALHDARRADEPRGIVQWLRPAFQEPRFAPEELVEQATALPAEEEGGRPQPKKRAWPSDALEQLGAVKDSVDAAPGTVAEIARRFRGARRDLVERHLEALCILAEVRMMEDARYHAGATARDLPLA
jgi:hypothetical protein